MAIVEMSKIKLFGLLNNKKDILNTLFRCGCVEVTDINTDINDECDLSKPVVTEEYALLSEKFDKTKKVVDYVESTATLIKNTNKELLTGKDLSSINNFFVNIEEFISIENKEQAILENVDLFTQKIEEIASLNATRNKLNNLRNQVAIYSNSPYKFTDFSDTFFTKCLYGIIKGENLQKLKDYIDKTDYASLEVIDENEVSIISVVFHKNIEVEVVERLNELGFNKCPFNFDMTAKEKLSEITNELKEIDNSINNIYKWTVKKLFLLRDIKILSDHYKFEIEKYNNAQDFVYTKQTFLMQGYLPTESIEKVKSELANVSNAIFTEFSKPTKDENPPTLCRNNKVVRQTEFITDLYSTPNYREMDPSKIIFFFFMLFMGLIMADIGYGLLMIGLGFVLARKQKVDNGSKRLWNIIAIGGIFTIIFGLLFDSFFGFNVIGYNVLPNPNISNGGTVENIYIMLLLCLLLGVIQIAVGYFCKAINCFMHRKIIDGLLDGIVWVLFFVGMVFAAFNFILDYFKVIFSNSLRNIFDTLQTPGLIMIAFALVVAVLTAGRYEKGFGKFTKGFGALYGLINIMSDILSYARLFGLMLSGMIIASTFNDMAIGMFASGGVFYILGGLIMIIGHIFNIAMGVLGAYIHDSRLQYIEFFGKFYTGEGEKFSPLGSQMDYVYLTR